MLKTLLSDDKLFIRREILSERFFILLGGWLEFTLMYNGLLSGFLYDLYLPVDRLSVKSRKLTTLRFVSLTMLRLNSFLNNLMNVYLILSAFRPLAFSKQDKRWSLYKPILSFRYFSPNLCRIQRPTTLHISAPSKLPIVTSKPLSPSFFYPHICTTEKKDFLECIIECSVIVDINKTFCIINCFKQQIVGNLRDKLLRCQNAWKWIYFYSPYFWTS